MQIEGVSCSECKFWTPGPEEYNMHKFKYPNVNLGVCHKAIPFWEASEWQEETLSRVLKEEHKDDLFFTQDGSDFSAVMYTKPNFFCASFVSKNG